MIIKCQQTPTGKETVYKACAVYHVKDNQIVEFFEYADMLNFMQQLGAIPSYKINTKT